MQSSSTTPKKTLRQTVTPSQTRHLIPSSPLTRLKNLTAEEVMSAAAVIQEDQHRQYVNMDLVVCWDSIPRLQLCGSYATWSVLMLALEDLYVISTRILKVGKRFTGDYQYLN
ncbi:hypothetical protein DSO57_1012814 [Entomophthora muscae]|uniref:Uncharacterized protein n=1 Tax=Entomophthora muscae TaxID=34485 RepID=A0ACC2RKK7_9FUNG|nr:hypothetical protein DSO57_1012814 [Entomophthora muscae]